jgi:hypothetical protein
MVELFNWLQLKFVEFLINLAAHIVEGKEAEEWF